MNTPASFAVTMQGSFDTNGFRWPHHASRLPAIPTVIELNE